MRPALILALRVVTVVVLCWMCILGVIALPNWGSFWIAGLIVAGLLVGLVVCRSRLLRFLSWGLWVLVGVLTIWLGLITWSLFSSGGPPPEPKSDPSSIRIVTWNLLRGEDAGPPWQQQNWPARKDPLRTAIRETGADVLCLQEALADQLAFLEESLPRHRRVGTPRGDGEHCAIFYNQDRFDALGQDTFWLEEPGREPGFGPGWITRVRICTWVRLRDRPSGRTFRVYNIHSYLTEEAQVQAARLTIEQISSGDPADAIILLGDFNAPPDSTSLWLFGKAGLTDSAELAGCRRDAPTIQWYGLAWRSLDGILVSPAWQVRHHRILNVKPNNTYPSDHFGVLADVSFSD